MNIGFIGLGKLGLPCAMASEKKGHIVFGIDPSPLTKKILDSKKLAYLEEGAQELLDDTNIKLVDYEFLVKNADLVFVAVQTPHDPKFEGITPITSDRKDFDYTFLCKAVESLCVEMKKQNVSKNVIIISTVLPGTIKKYVRPIIDSYGLNEKFNLVYNPFFIAMGTTIENFTNPEFVLLGTDSYSTADFVESFYGTIHSRPLCKTTIENAELIKVTYNTFIGMKIAFANTVMEICHKTPNTNCDSVVDALSIATDRIISTKYLRGGMGDGGGCHPRDNIALSWLAKQLDLSHDMFNDIMIARENQTKWLAELIKEQFVKTRLPVWLFGAAYKPNTNICIGSPALLLSHYLHDLEVPHEIFDPYVAQYQKKPADCSVIFVSTRHDNWLEFDFPNYSVVIDPFRYLQKNTSISRYFPIGEKNDCNIDSK
jgi:UDPglucose 6-dehydrogenase